LNQCTDDTIVSCVNNVFDFEDGTVDLCNAQGSGPASNLVGQTISAYMMAGSQGGSFPGNRFSIMISDGRNGTTPVTVGITDGATSGGGQLTGWRLVSGVVPNNAVGRAARLAILSIDVPEQNNIDFHIDDIRIGD
jgi:hypothetical protein